MPAKLKLKPRILLIEDNAERIELFREWIKGIGMTNISLLYLGLQLHNAVVLIDPLEIEHACFVAAIPR